jgi:hypothetical protein
MARSKKHSPRSIVLRQRFEIEATPVPFTTFDSVRHLDVARLSRAAHARVELGYFDTGCCRRVLHAVVRKGLVTKLELEPCKEPVRMTPELKPELKKVLQAVGKKLRARKSGSYTLPMPVKKLLGDQTIFYFSGWWCTKICVFGHCLICCKHVGGGGPVWSGCAIDKKPSPF